MRKILIITLVLIIVAFVSCNKIDYYSAEENTNTETKILAHRGVEFSTQFQENTLEAVIYGIEKLDGVEFDIQISKDNTLWLNHNAEFEECNGSNLKCFPLAIDDEIVELDSCNGNDYTFSRLEEVFKHISENNIQKQINIDVKAWKPCSISSLNILKTLKISGDKIIELSRKYHIEEYVMVQSNVKSLLTHIVDNSNKIETYLATYGDFETGISMALKNGYTGITFDYSKSNIKLTTDHIRLLKEKGLKIQLFTINQPEIIEEVLLLKPDYIQSSNIEYFQ